MSPSPDPAQRAAHGVAMMLLGVLLFAVNDTLGKWLVGTYPVGQPMLVRSVAGLCVMAPFIWSWRRCCSAAPWCWSRAGPRPARRISR